MAKDFSPISHDVFEGVVERISSEGSGVVIHNGVTYFIRGVMPGDVLSSPYLTRSKKRYREAKLISIKTPSPFRCTPSCRNHGYETNLCGGCPWMFISYDKQIEFKANRVRYAFSRFGIDLGDAVMRPLWPSEKTLHYRNRAQFKTDGLKLGFVSEGTNHLVDIKECPVLSHKLQDTLSSLRSTLPNEQWIPSQEFPWRFIDIDEDFGDLNSLILDKRRPFRQANSEQNVKMKKWLSETIKDWPQNQGVLELFCGLGNFTEVLSEHGFQKILAVEISGESLEILRKKNLERVEVFESNLYAEGAIKKLAKIVKREEIEILFVNPPRDGVKCRKQVMEYFPNLHRLLYVSCNPESMACDLSDFIKHGWEISEIQPLDQFPHTPHVEILASLIRSKKH